MRGALKVQSLKMAAIMSQHSAAQRMSAGEDVRVWSCPPTVLLGRNHVMPQLAQQRDDREREIFIRVKLHPPSLHKSFLALFVLADGSLDLFRVSGGISKSSFQIRGR